MELATALAAFFSGFTMLFIGSLKVRRGNQEQGFQHIVVGLMIIVLMSWFYFF